MQGSLNCANDLLKPGRGLSYSNVLCRSYKFLKVIFFYFTLKLVNYFCNLSYLSRYQILLMILQGKMACKISDKRSPEVVLLLGSCWVPSNKWDACVLWAVSDISLNFVICSLKFCMFALKSSKEAVVLFLLWKWNSIDWHGLHQDVSASGAFCYFEVYKDKNLTP